MNPQGLNPADALGMQLISAGDVMGWLGGLPLSMLDGVRMGRATADIAKAEGAGNAGAVDCASGGGECGVGAGCAGGSGCCGIGGECAGH